MSRSVGVILLIVAACFAVSFGCRFNPNGHQNLDFARYSGQWFLLETGPRKVNDSAPLNCIYEAYAPTVSPVIYDLTWQGKTNEGSIVDDSGIVTLPNLNLQSNLDFFIDGTVFSSKVLATDYSTWAIEYTCNEKYNWERFMLRSRTRTISQAVRTTLHNVINSYGVQVGDFFVVNHTNC